jgi:myo-inositol 2-dehydrogenase/D-chiro-inositol 1-dehydrogenase
MSQAELKPSNPSRRDFLKTSTIAAVGAGALSTLAAIPGAYAAGTETIKIGLVGCGGRGTGAAAQALQTSGDVKIVAMGDLFADRLNGAADQLKKSLGEKQERFAVDKDHMFTGFDAFEKVIGSDIDLIVLATPPHFRPQHFAAAIAAGKHCFIEKPVAVDGPGVRQCLKTAEEAKAKNLAVVCGLQRHHQFGYVESMKRLHDIVAARAYWNMGSLWMNARKPEWSDMEWQLRNWLYFAWLSGDHICEQHVHNLDVVNWAKQGHPVRCFGQGGRQVRTDPAYGHIFDHHDVHYEYADGSWLFSQCRQIPGCLDSVSEHMIGTKGKASLDSGRWSMEGATKWRFTGANNNPYQTEHDDLFASIREGKPLNEGKFVAESTLTAIMGRMATYSGKMITWDQALNSELKLGPDKYEFGSLPVPPVAVPGETISF